MAQPLLSGEQEYVDPVDPTYRKLENEIENLERRLQRSEMELRHAKEGVQATLSELRRLTLPFLNLLKAIHGEIDALGIPEYPASTVSAPKAEAWELWKQKLPGFPSRMIDALLKHGELSVSQLVVAAQCPRKQTIYDAASKLGKLGLISQNGGKYSLKQL